MVSGYLCTRVLNQLCQSIPYTPKGPFANATVLQPRRRLEIIVIALQSILLSVDSLRIAVSVNWLRIRRVRRDILPALSSTEMEPAIRMDAATLIEYFKMQNIVASVPQ